MLLELLILVVSLFFVVKSADFLIDYSIILANRFQISAMVIGMTIVAIGTSLPELATSLIASFRGYGEIVVGNVVGSNICNVALIIGASAAYAGVNCHWLKVKKEAALLITVSTLLLVVSYFAGEISRTAGLLLLLGFIGFVFWMLTSKGTDASDEEEFEDDGSSLAKILTIILLSIVVLLISSEFLVNSVVALATALGVSQNVIAVSVIAFGTSIPELSVSLVSAKRHEDDILIGNILGSNITNILLVLGASAAVQAVAIPANTLRIDLPIMILLSLLLVGFLYTKVGVTRGRGVMLLLLYGLFIVRCVMIPQ